MYKYIHKGKAIRIKDFSTITLKAKAEKNVIQALKDNIANLDYCNHCNHCASWFDTNS